MALDWSTVKGEHVSNACELLLKGRGHPRASAKGLFVVIEGQRLPAKHVLRLAYCLANELSPEAAPKFASGEGTVKLLQRLGFAVERTLSRTSPQQPESEGH